MFGRRKDNNKKKLNSNTKGLSADELMYSLDEDELDDLMIGFGREEGEAAENSDPYPEDETEEETAKEDLLTSEEKNPWEEMITSEENSEEGTSSEEEKTSEDAEKTASDADESAPGEVAASEKKLKVRGKRQRRAEASRADRRRVEYFDAAEGFRAKEYLTSTKDMDLTIVRKWPGRVAKAVTLLLLAAAGAALLVSVFRSGLVAQKYIIVAVMILAVIFVLIALLEFRKSRLRYLGYGLSIVMTIVMGVGIYAFTQTNSVLEYMGASTKTSEMVLLVRSDDEAKILRDAEGYTVGISTDVEVEDTRNTLDAIRSELGHDVTTKEYGSMSQLAHALTDGEVNAALINKAYVSILDESLEGFSSGTKSIYKHTILKQLEVEQVATGEPFSIYISGIDTDGSISQDSRSDTNIIMTVNPKTKKILLTTTPRDYFVQIPGVSGSRRDKLTHAGIYGVDASMNTLESVYGIDITYYLRVNFKTLVDIVDAIGGVDMYSDTSFQAFTDADVYINEGWTHMDGRTALAFSRERYSFADGDNQRGRNQMAMLKAILQKVMSPSILVNAGDFLNSLEGSFQTNMTTSKLMELVNQQLNEGGEWTIQRQSVTGTGDYQMTYSAGGYILYVMWPDENSTKEAAARIQMFMEEEPGSVTTETSENAATVSTVN